MYVERTGAHHLKVGEKNHAEMSAEEWLQRLQNRRHTCKHTRDSIKNVKTITISWTWMRFMKHMHIRFSCVYQSANDEEPTYLVASQSRRPQ